MAAGSGAAEELLRNADVAMYRAKRGGAGRFEVFEPGMRRAMLERLELEADLQRAVEREEFELHYQPVWELRERTVSGVEALLRWRHPRRGLVPPSSFIPLAEETELIVPIGRWVLDEGCRQLARWQQEHVAPAPLTMSVNLSGRQLQHPGLVAEVASRLRAHGLDPRTLVLEVTETVLMEDADIAIERLAELRSLGVRVAVDDFGTGYSSLGYLRRFPVDILKVAKPFVDGVAQGPDDLALVRAMVEMGGSLNLRVVAEGIEGSDQLDALEALGCDLGQGFHLARPAEASAVGRLLGASPPSRTAA